MEEELCESLSFFSVRFEPCFRLSANLSSEFNGCVLSFTDFIAQSVDTGEDCAHVRMSR